MFWKKKKQGVSLNPRQSKRMQADYLMRFKPYGSEQEPVYVNATDVSATGLRFLTDQFYVEGTLLDISIAVPPIGKSIDISGEIVRIRPSDRSTGLYYISIRFFKINPDDQTALNAFIERLASTKGAGFMVDQFKEHWRKPISDRMPYGE